MKKVLFILIVFSWLVGQGQDFHLSQFEASPMHLNPAMTGAFEGDHRLSIHYRNQWRSIATKAFVTSALSYDTPIHKVNGLSLGGFILNNRAGAGGYNALNLILSGSYDYSLKSNPHHHFVGGLQFGMIHKSVDITKLSFGSQYTPQDGGGLNPNLASNEFINSQAAYLFDLNVGGIYYFSSDVSRFNPFFGGSVFHLTQPRESFYEVDNRLPRRYLLHGGLKYNLSQKIQVTGYVLGMKQLNNHELITGVFGYYYFKNSNAYIMYGNTWRSKDAILVHLDIKWRDLIYRFSYDINYSALAAVTSGQGGFEFSVVYVLKNINPEPIKGCSRL